MLDGESDEFRAVAKKLKTWGINMLFVIGGEGGMRMVTELSEWCVKEKVRGLGGRRREGRRNGAAACVSWGEGHGTTSG
jgi:hypothetical protein